MSSSLLSPPAALSPEEPRVPLTVLPRLPVSVALSPAHSEASKGTGKAPSGRSEHAWSLPLFPPPSIPLSGKEAFLLLSNQNLGERR